MNETVLTQEGLAGQVANNLSVWINDSVFLDITADFTKERYVHSCCGSTTPTTPVR